MARCCCGAHRPSLGLWATKLAVACGSSESISKLFSTQRRRIYALEQRTVEAQMNNEAMDGMGLGWEDGKARLVEDEFDYIGDENRGL